MGAEEQRTRAAPHPVGQVSCLSLCLGALVLSTACVRLFQPASASAAEPTLTIITPHAESIRIEFKRGFSQWHARHYGEPARVEWRDLGGTSDALKFVLSEFVPKPDGIGIDCFFGGGLEPFLLLSEKQLTQPYRPPPAILDAIPQKLNGVDLYDAGGAWYGAAISSFGILQNTRLQQMVHLPRVTRWDELANPALRGWIGVGDPRNSGTMVVMFEAVLQAYGWEGGWRLLTQIGGNARNFGRISSVTAKDVTLGETAYGFAIDFYGFTQVAVAGRSNLAFVLPRDFAPMSADGLCILKGAPHLVSARRFVDFVLSEDGQRLWFLPKGHPDGPQQYSIERMSVRPDFYRRYRGVSNIEFSPFDLQQPFVYDSKLGSARRGIVSALAGAMLVDTHPELKEAWRAVVQRGRPEQDVQQLGRVPIRESEALTLAATTWKDPALRNQTKIAWQRWALEKYRALR
jgi:ABC-type Fe3+ transport system substrate-binding protein